MNDLTFDQALVIVADALGRHHSHVASLLQNTRPNSPHDQFISPGELGSLLKKLIKDCAPLPYNPDEDN